jgi:hypothetical protein
VVVPQRGSKRGRRGHFESVKNLTTVSELTPVVVSHAMWRNSSQIIWRKQGHLTFREAAIKDKTFGKPASFVQSEKAL